MVFLRLKTIWINVVGFIKIPMKYVILGIMDGLQSFLSREEIFDHGPAPSAITSSGKDAQATHLCLRVSVRHSALCSST